MAVRFDSLDWVTSSAIHNMITFTECVWFYLVIGGSNAIILYRNDFNVDSQWIEVTLDSANTLYVGNGAGFQFGSVISTGIWYYLALVKNGAVHQLYLNGTLNATHTDGSSTTAINRQYLAALGNSTSGVLHCNCRLAYYKCWSGVALTPAEIRQEMRYVYPVRRAHLHRFTPLWHANYLWDASRYGRHWTVGNGTLATEADPPVVQRLARSLYWQRAGAAATVTSAIWARRRSQAALLIR